MNKELIEKNQIVIAKIIEEITESFKENKAAYLLTKAAVAKASPVGYQEVKKRQKYGIHLNKIGEKYIDHQTKRFESYFVQFKKMDKYEAGCAAYEIMCTYILKEVFRRLEMPFNSTYDKLQERKSVGLSIKLVLYIVFAAFLVFAVVALLFL